MSRTRRKHASLTTLNKRGPKNRVEDELPKNVRKTMAQKRRSEKQALRREWL